MRMCNSTSGLPSSVSEKGSEMYSYGSSNIIEYRDYYDPNSGLGSRCYSMAIFRLPLSTNLGVPIFVKNRIFSDIRKDMGANIFIHLHCTDEDNFSVCTLTIIRVFPSVCTSKLIQSSLARCRIVRSKTVEIRIQKFPFSW